MFENLGFLNLFANLLMIYMIFQQRKMISRLESVIAPKTGIEGYLNMCAQVVESDPDGTCVVSDKGEIVMVNRRFEDITGYHRSEMVGRQIEILVPDAVKEIHTSHREGFTMRPSARPMRGLSLRHKSGKELAVDIRLNRYIDVVGGFTIAKVRVPEP